MKLSNSATIVLLSLVAIVLFFNESEARLLNLKRFDSILAQLPTNNGPVCYGEFGCYNKSELSKEWKVPNIIAGHYPEPPEKQDVHFHFFTCKDRYNPTILPYNVREADLRRDDLNFDPKNRTLFMVHGYTDNYDQFNWMGDAKDHILRKKSCHLNVIVVDWRGGSKVPNYLQAASNTRLVGYTVATLIKKLNKAFGTRNDDYMVMGHSLGGQIAGFVGKNVRNPKLRLIIGLDPAGPAFSDVSLQSRLNPDDAQLVITIQTNGGVNVADGYGLLIPSGHYSFFPNGGENQPGCDPVHGVTSILMNGLFEGVSDTVACSHRRAYWLAAYDESKFDDYESVAYRCANYSDFSAGKCGTCRDGTDDCVPWLRLYDYWENQKLPKDWVAPISYYVDTRAKVPYSYFHYQIKVKTGDGFNKYDGRLFLNMTGTLRNDFSEEIKMDDIFEPNREYTYLHKSIKSIGRIVSLNATLTDVVVGQSTTQKVTEAIRGIIPGKKKSSDEITIREIRINYMNGYTESKRRSMSAILRPEGNQDSIKISRNEVTTFRDSKSSSRSPSPSNNRGGSNQDRPNRDRPTQGDRNRPLQGERDRPLQSDRNRPLQGDRDRPLQGDRDRPLQGDRDRPLQGDRDRPLQGDRDRPLQGDRDRPLQGDRDRPLQGDRDRPLQGDRDRPLQGDRDRPLQGDRDRPLQSDRDRPLQGDRDRPLQGDRNRPLQGDRDRPLQGDRDRSPISNQDRNRTRK